MKKRLLKAGSIFNSLGALLSILAIVILLPLLIGLCYGEYAQDPISILVFIIPSFLSMILGIGLQRSFKFEGLGTREAMLTCALAWITVSFLGALPYTLALRINFLNAYFETMSGFTTTGITMLSGLDNLPKSILFWRALTQWLGGLGILTFFLIVSFRAPSAVFKLYGAESHKIAAPRLKPGIFNTLKVLWTIYLIFSLLEILILKIEGLSFFDSLTHTFTTLSTGGYSTHDASIDYFRQAGYSHYNLIEYTFSFFMLLGGISFLVHYQVLKGKFNSLWKGIEMRYFWGILFVSILLIMGNQLFIQRVESIATTFKYTLFQVISIFTTTGYTTKNIASPFFPALAKQIFLILMVIGGCVGSTAGGIKVLRVAVLDRVVKWKTHQLKSSRRAVTPLLLEGKSISTEEVQGIVTLFAGWIILLMIGGLITAFFTKLGPLESFSGMFSALGNIGPCYIKSFDMIHIGRLEILPVLLLFSPRAWR